MSELDPWIGKTFAGRYKLERRIGSGGMGRVYVALQEPLGREVALKLLRPDRADDEVIVERFRNEAKLIAQLGHPHIVTIHDFGESEDGTLFLAMERLRGQVLADAIGDRPLEPMRAFAIARDIARALSAAHAQGVIHRDLKPENVYLVKAEAVDDFVKVLDFGIAKLVRDQEVPAKNLTGTGLVAGTPGYIAPEQVLGEAADDPRADLYALGVLLFQMLTGKRPFEAESAMKIFLQQLEQPAPKLREVAPDLVVDDDIADLIGELLARDPSDRPASADLVRARLERAVGTSPHTTPPRSPRPELPPLGPMDATAADNETPAPASVPQLPTMVSAIDEVPRTTTTNPRPFPTGDAPRARRTWLLLAPAAAVLIAAAVWLNPASTNNPQLHRALPLHSDDPAVFADFDRALDALLDGEYGQAERLARRVLAAAPEEPAAVFLLGAVLDRGDDPWAAYEQFERASALVHEDQCGACASRGPIITAVRDVVGHPERGEAIYAACEPCQTNPVGVLIFARALRSEMTADDGLMRRLLDDAERLAPRRVLTHADRSRFFLDQNDAEGAKRAARRGQQMNPRSPALRVSMAEALISEGDHDGAIDQLRGVASGPEVTAALAHAYLLQGDEDRRRALIESQLAVSDPRGAHFLMRHHGLVLVGVGRVEEGLALMTQALQRAVVNGERRTAVQLGILTVNAATAAESYGHISQIVAANDSLLKSLEVTPSEHAVFAALGLVEKALLALEKGDLSTTQSLIDQFMGPGAQRLPSLPRRVIPAYLNYMQAVIESDGKKARANIPDLPHLCNRELAFAVVDGVDGDPLPRLAALTTPPLIDMCIGKEHDGIYVLRAYAHRAEGLLKAGNTEAARSIVKEARARFPKADAALKAVVRLDAVERALAQPN